LVHLANTGDAKAITVGLDLIQTWAHFDTGAVDQALAPLALNLASRPVQGGHRRELFIWRKVLQLLSPSYPRQVAELAVELLTAPDNSGGWADPENLEVLTRAAAVNPAAVMEAVGGDLLDRNRRLVFGIAVFHGLFEAIGLQHVDGWLNRHGFEYLPWLARHFPSPHLDEAGQPVLPPLTEWLFREHEADDEAFRWFLMGCHSGTGRSEAETSPARKRAEMQPFLKHELRRVREWAESEIQEEERYATHFREMDEEDQRR
jgi:hypothetical protein